MGVRIEELDEVAFKATMPRPARRPTPEEPPPVQLALRPYLEALCRRADLDPSRYEVADTFCSPTFTHVLFARDGSRSVFVVIVIDNTLRAVHGFHHLDLGARFGVE